VDLVHLNVPLANLAIAVNVALIALARVAGKNVVVHFRGGELSLNTDVNFLQRAAIRIFLTLSKVIVVLGSREREFLISHYGRQFESKIHVLPNAVMLREMDSESVLGKFSDASLQLIYFGRMDLAKGLAEIVEALASCLGDVDFHLHLVGEGPALSELEKMLSVGIADRYTVHGSKSQDSLLSILEGCHLFLLPSHFEGLPNSLLEAMANYVVPIVTPVGAIPELVKHRDNGFVVQVKEPMMLKEAICDANADRALLGEMAHRGRLLMERDFSIDGYCERLSAIYRQALS